MNFNYLEIKKIVYQTEEHPQVASTLEMIARECNLMGDSNEALNLLEKVLGLIKKSYKTII